MFGKQETAVLHVEGMSCEHCAARVKKALEGLKAVKRAEVDLGKKEVMVTGKNLQQMEMKQAVEEAGYQVV